MVRHILTTVLILLSIASMNNCSSNDSKLSFSSKLQRYSRNPIVNPRDLISPTTQSKKVVHTADPCALWDEEEKTWRVFWSFWDLEAESTGQMATGIWGATSKDGVNFSPLAQLALDQIGSFDSDSVETCDLVKAPNPDNSSSNLYFLYYSGNSNSNPDTSYHKIGLALSTDGKHFEPISIAQSPKGEEGLLFTGADTLGGLDVPGNLVTDPTVVYLNNQFHMWTLCIKQVPIEQANGGICYHTSSNGINWTHHGLTSGLTSIAFPIQPSVYYNHKKTRFEMLVVADTPTEETEIHNVSTNLSLRVKGWYQAHSVDGINWQFTDSKRVFNENTALPWENGGLATGGDIEVKGDNLYFYYPSFTSQGGVVIGDLLNWPLNLATKKLD